MVHENETLALFPVFFSVTSFSKTEYVAKAKF